LRSFPNYAKLICHFSWIIAKLPKWFGERPGKKPGDPESPEGEEDVKAAVDDDLEEPQFDEEEEEEVKEEGEEEEEEEEEMKGRGL